MAGMLTAELVRTLTRKSTMDEILAELGWLEPRQTWVAAPVPRSTLGIAQRPDAED
jgi:hypothetical protein